MAQEHITTLLAQEETEKQYISFEFFPPRTEAAEKDFLEIHLPRFNAQKPMFMDLTWGAGGSTSGKTMRLCKEMKDKYDVVVNMHITCTNMPEGLVREALDFCKENGISNIVALRGDPPAGHEWKANPDGFGCAKDLVKYIREEFGNYFCISVAGYPEGHPAKINDETGKVSEEDMKVEMQYLKEKVDAGADLIITQLFYDTETFLTFVKKCREIGITIPILPGLLPFGNYASLQRMVKLCKTYIPEKLHNQLELVKDDPEKVRQCGVDWVIDMIQEIKDSNLGVHHFHFYTVNAIESTFRILKHFGLEHEWS